MKTPSVTPSNDINDMLRIVRGLGVSINQAALLLALPPSDTPQDKRITPSEVADIMGITRGGVTRLCRTLLTRKLIAHERNPDDWRFVVLQRTKKGDALVFNLMCDTVKEDA